MFRYRGRAARKEEGENGPCFGIGKASTGHDCMLAYMACMHPRTSTRAQDILTRTPQDPDVEVKKAKRTEYAAGKMADYFSLLNQVMMVKLFD